MEIIIDDLSGQEIADFLEEHIREMKSISPPESKHALDIEGLREPEITFWSVYKSARLVGCGAISELDKMHCELKSMRIDKTERGSGIASKLLSHILETAKSRGFQTVRLETGSMRFFEPARNLYSKFGFKYCEPFGNYKEDPNSVFMARDL